ncbi:MAG: DUF378 domain-containing protein [Oscillospiraceae bacterium]|jgi:uncharacterized membrane protein YuzA (DUF378 family)|nr:DUF378 domain-containing protein [Oscillospiraceae bacterium]
MILDRIALVLTILGAVNLGSVGIFGYNLLARLFGGAATTLTRVVFTLIGLAGLWCISLLFREHEYRTRSDRT